MGWLLLRSTLHRWGTDSAGLQTSRLCSLLAITLQRMHHLKRFLVHLGMSPPWKLLFPQFPLPAEAHPAVPSIEVMLSDGHPLHPQQGTEEQSHQLLCGCPSVRWAPTRHIIHANPHSWPGEVGGGVLSLTHFTDEETGAESKRTCSRSPSGTELWSDPWGPRWLGKLQ